MQLFGNFLYPGWMNIRVKIAMIKVAGNWLQYRIRRCNRTNSKFSSVANYRTQLNFDLRPSINQLALYWHNSLPKKIDMPNFSRLFLIACEYPTFSVHKVVLCRDLIFFNLNFPPKQQRNRTLRGKRSSEITGNIGMCSALK